MFFDVQETRYVTEREIRDAHPDKLFGTPFTPPVRYKVVFPTPQPLFNPVTQYLSLGNPEMDEHGNLNQTWVIHSHTQEQITKNIEDARMQFKAMVIDCTQQRLDVFAATAGYDNVNSMSKYQNITDEEIATLDPSLATMVTKFRAEARYLNLATAATWAKLYSIMFAVEAGNRAMPVSYEEVEAELPNLEWPT